MSQLTLTKRTPRSIAPRVKKLFKGQPHATLFRRQGWEAIQHLLPRPANVKDARGEPGFKSDADWAALKKQAAALKIRWDEQRQAYVAQ